ncbi:ankyrin repeat-containing protein [Anaeramoeba flamelloides]|uniref:Ankyrin repeat-containing protein n=1 Tax=Anaeramoeba flamelloides TaxID=1746091 RepID=A0ABQ8YZ13_9EUKA|nr:ankyrin repeat-containing protein [Anaeramoeba flamelloides]
MIESFNNYPFVLDDNQKHPKCDFCENNKPDALCYCENLNKLFCARCYYLQEKHKNQRQWFFNLINNEFTHNIMDTNTKTNTKTKTKTKKKSGINLICLCRMTAKLLKLCIEQGGDLRQKDRYGHTPFLEICQRKPKKDLLKLCLVNGCNFNQTNSLGINPFHTICLKSEGDLELIDYCMRNAKGRKRQKARITKSKTDGKNILHFLSEKPITDFTFGYLEFFVKKNPKLDFNCREHNKKDTPFHYLCKNAQVNLRLVKFFFKNGSNANLQNIDKQSPFHIFCLHQHKNQQLFKIIKLFVEQGADMNLKDQSNRTPFYNLCSEYCKNPIDVLPFCLKKGANPTIKSKSYSTPFSQYCSAYYSHNLDPQIIMLFLESKAQLSTICYNSYVNDTAFHKICNQKNITLQLIDTCLKKGGKLDQKNNNKKTPFYHLCRHTCDYEIIKLCLNKSGRKKSGKAKFRGTTMLNQKHEDKETAFHLLCLHPNLDVKLLKLCFKYTKPNVLNWKGGYDETTPFYNLCSKNHSNFDLIKFCIDHNANPIITTKDNLTPFSNILKNTTNKKIIELLLTKVDDNNIINLRFKRIYNSGHNTLFFVFCESRQANLKSLKIFLQKGGRIPGYLGKGNSFFSFICSQKNPNFKFVQQIVENFELKDLNVGNPENKTALHMVVQANNVTVEVLQSFLDKGFDLHSKCADGRQPFHFYCARQILEKQILKFFVNNGCDLNNSNLQKKTPFFVICERPNPNFQIIKYCLKNGADPNKLSQSLHIAQYTPFSIICKNQNQLTPELFDLFMEHGYKINALNPNHENCFHCYCSCKSASLEIIKLFIKYKINVNQFNGNGNTPLMILSRSLKVEDLKLIQFLLDNGARQFINHADQYGETAFHKFCARNHNVDVYKFFLENGADCNLLTCFGQAVFYQVSHKITNIDTKNGTTPYDVLYRNSKKISPKFSTQIKNLASINFNCIIEDFENFFKRKEFMDYEIKGIKAHSTFLEWRTKKKIQELSQIFEKYPKETINEFIKFIYTDSNIFLKQHQMNNQYSEKNDTNNIEEDDDDDEHKFKKLCKELDISLNFKTNNTLKNSIQELFLDEKSKDFTIVINGSKTNEKIKVHKFILQCRSELFRGMFLTIEDPDIDSINEYSGMSFESFQIFVKYLYTEKIGKKVLLNSKIKSELSDCADYYQINPNSNFNWYLDYY